TGVSRTGISHHFPKKTDFTAALDGRIFKLFVEHLEFNKGLNEFSQSWVVALEDEEFRAILRLLFHHIVTAERAHEFAANGIDRLYKMTESQFGEESKKELEWLFGKSLVRISQ
ncbi:transcriptional regulator, partial [Vibrio vulnificus]